MLRKLLFSCLLISSFSYGQFNQDAPWMQKIKTKSNQTSKAETISIDDISKAFNEYWLDKDYKKKVVATNHIKDGKITGIISQIVME